MKRSTILLEPRIVFLAIALHGGNRQMETRSLLLSDHDRRSDSVPNQGTLSIVTPETIPIHGAPDSAPIRDSSARRSQRADTDLTAIIRRRIEDQTCGRIRNLSVTVHGGHVILQGRCATYYSKQLAQHAAMGVLEEEVLLNDIAVLVAR